jgi:hypothetical protein
LANHEMHNYFDVTLSNYNYSHKSVPIGRGVCDSKNPPVPLSSRGNVTRLKLLELTNNDNTV